MLRIFGFCLKITFFSILILILGNTIHWEGRTISDQVKLRMSHADRSPIVNSVRNWAEKVTHDARKGILRRPYRTEVHSLTSIHEEIPSSERQKLKALIEELNSSRKENE